MSEDFSPAMIEELGVRLAELARRAYAPYSRFHVAALGIGPEGVISEGVNFENASYGLSLCAETVALAAAATAGGFESIRAVAVIGGRMGENGLEGDALVLPCGRCRQILFETASLQGRDVTILSFSGDRTRHERTSILKLLPDAFGPGNLV